MINRFKWLEVAKETRQNIALYLKDFTDFPEFKKSAMVEVAGNRVVCDGFTDQDLCNLTPELLIAALGEDTLEARGIDKNDVYALFYELVTRLEMPVVELKDKPVAEVEDVIEPETEPVIEPDLVDKTIVIKKTLKK